MIDSVTPSYKDMILKAMEYHFPGAKIYLFGSRARGDYRPGSDIDIAVDAGQIISTQEIWRARNTLENLIISLEIDLVDMHAVPAELKELILHEGILWKN